MPQKSRPAHEAAAQRIKISPAGAAEAERADPFADRKHLIRVMPA
jgi:hypothetical protein